MSSAQAIRKDFHTHRRLYFILRGCGFQRDVTVVDIFQDEFFQPLERIAIAAAPSLLEAAPGARGDRARLNAVHLLRLRRVWIDARAREWRSLATVKTPRTLPMVRRTGRQDAIDEQLIFAHIPNAAAMAARPG